MADGLGECGCGAPPPTKYLTYATGHAWRGWPEVDTSVPTYEESGGVYTLNDPKLKIPGCSGGSYARRFLELYSERQLSFHLWDMVTETFVDTFWDFEHVERMNRYDNELFVAFDSGHNYNDYLASPEYSNTIPWEIDHVVEGYLNASTWERTVYFVDPNGSGSTRSVREFIVLTNEYTQAQFETDCTTLYGHKTIHDLLNDDVQATWCLYHVPDAWPWADPVIETFSTDEAYVAPSLMHKGRCYNYVDNTGDPPDGMGDVRRDNPIGLGGFVGTHGPDVYFTSGDGKTQDGPTWYGSKMVIPITDDPSSIAGYVGPPQDPALWEGVGSGEELQSTMRNKDFCADWDAVADSCIDEDAPVGTWYSYELDMFTGYMDLWEGACP